MAPSDPLKDSVRCTAVTATLEAGITCPSGVTGMMRIGAVIMTGGGSSSCSIADHVIGITEANEAIFDTSYSQSDFGENSGSGTSSYSLSLWYKLV